MSLTIYAEVAPVPPVTLKIAVIGMGYIGLPTAAALASAGHDVIGVDINQHVVDTINAGACHIVEPGLNELLSQVVGDGHLRAERSTPVADAYLIAVPTPVSRDADRTPDLSYVFAATDSIAPQLRPGALVVLESTSPVGATRMVAERLAAARPDLKLPSTDRPDDETDIDIVYSPERVIPGKTLSELATNARVMGGMTPQAAKRAAALYRSLTSGELLLTSDRAAEMVKLVENAFRDVNIAFANELSLICEKVNLDVWELIALANYHPRVNILRPGPGVGGHCIAVDPWFIVAQAPEQSRLIRTAREVNDAKPRFVIEKARALLLANPQANLACLGLTFKPDVDDFRESPALEIARSLSREFPGRVVCSDPFQHMLTGADDLTFVTWERGAGASIVLGLVAHREFRAMPRPGGTLVDPAGVWQ